MFRSNFFVNLDTTFKTPILLNLYDFSRHKRRLWRLQIKLPPGPLNNLMTLSRKLCAVQCPHPSTYRLAGTLYSLTVPNRRAPQQYKKPFHFSVHPHLISLTVWDSNAKELHTNFNFITMTKKGLLERLAEGPVIGDGGFVFAMEKRGYVKAGPWTPEVVMSHPESGKNFQI